MFRPGIIEPLDGIKSKTNAYQIFYTLGKPLFPVIRLILPNQIVTTRQIGRAMLNVARNGWPNRVMEIKDIRAAAQS